MGRELNAVGLVLALKPGRLFPVPDAALVGLIGNLPLLQADVVQAPVGLQHEAKFPTLVTVDPQTVFEGSEHVVS